MHVLKTFWGDAILIVCHLIIRIPSSSSLQGQTTFFIFHQDGFAFDFPFKGFRCARFAHIFNGHCKLNPWTTKHIYSRTWKTYRCWNLLGRKYMTFAQVTSFGYMLYFSTYFIIGVSTVLDIAFHIALPSDIVDKPKEPQAKEHSTTPSDLPSRQICF